MMRQAIRVASLCGHPIGSGPAQKTRVLLGRLPSCIGLGPLLDHVVDIRRDIFLQCDECLVKVLALEHGFQLSCDVVVHDRLDFRYRHPFLLEVAGDGRLEPAQQVRGHLRDFCPLFGGQFVRKCRSRNHGSPCIV